MRSETRRLWELQDRHVGDRQRLFGAVSEFVHARRVLYPGSYVDLAASFVWPEVTYIDLDRRAERFFADCDGVTELLVEHGADPAEHTVRFIRADYTSSDLDLPDDGFDLLVSLYAGLVSDHCTRFLRPGGTLLVNPSHGDVAMASIDDRYRLLAVVTARSGTYAVRTTDLDTYLIPKRDVEITRQSLRASGRGIAYAKSPFAYLFQRVS